MILLETYEIDKDIYDMIFDYRHPRNKIEEQTKFELHQLKEKLDKAGIKILNIWLTDEDKEKWLEEKHRKETSEQLKKMS